MPADKEKSLFPPWAEKALVALVLIGVMGALGVWHRVGIMEERQSAYREALGHRLEAMEARWDAKLSAMESRLLRAIEARWNKEK